MLSKYFEILGVFGEGYIYRLKLVAMLLTEVMNRC
jgi:hypothetical protein